LVGWIFLEGHFYGFRGHETIHHSKGNWMSFYLVIVSLQ
jgi:hypothetical protein